MDVVPGEFPTSVQTLQLNEKIKSDNRAAELTNETDRRFRRSSGGQQVIDDQDMLSHFDRITVHREAIVSVLEAVFHFITIGWKFPRLANWDKSSAKTCGENPAKDKAPRLDAHDLGNAAILISDR